MKFTHDTFTDTALGTFQPNTSGVVPHAGEIGAVWKAGAGLAGSGFKFDSTGARIRSNNGNANSYFFSTAQAQGDSTYCEITYDCVTAVDNIGPVVRAANAAGYHALINPTSITVRRLESNSSFTTLTYDSGGTTKAITQAANSRHTCRITATGTNPVVVEVKFDGVILGTVTDSSATRIAAFGGVGFTGFGAFNDATGMHIDSIVGYSAAPAATAFSVVGKTSITKNTAGLFYINPNGDTTSTFTVSDGAGGGTFSSTTVAADGSFAYTPTTSGNKTLTVTSSSGLPAQTVAITVLSVPTAAVTSQPAPSGQSIRFIGTASDATSGTYTLTGSDGGVTVGPTAFTVANNTFDFTVSGLVPGTYSPTLTISGPGGTAGVTGTNSFAITPISGGGELPAAAPSDTIAPVIAAAAVANAAPGVLVLTVSEALDETSVPAGSAFTVAGHTVSSVVVTGSQIKLNVTPDFVGGEAARTLAYTQPTTSPLKDVAKNVLASFSGRGIVNNVLPPPATVTGVIVTPATVTLAGGATQQFTGSVVGQNNPSQTLTWTRSPALGSVSATGLFTAPPATNSAQVVNVTAKSDQDPTYSATAVVTIPAALPADTAFTRSKTRTIKIKAAPLTFEGGPFWDLKNPRRPVGSIDKDATIDISFDWTEVLADIADTIKTVHFDLNGLTSRGGFSSNGIATVFVAEATGNPRITCTITTSSLPARIEERTVFLNIEEQ